MNKEAEKRIDNWGTQVLGSITAVSHMIVGALISGSLSCPNVVGAGYIAVLGYQREPNAAYLSYFSYRFQLTNKSFVLF